MNFKQLQIELYRYLLIEDPDVRTTGIIKQILNDTILSFARIKNWLRLQSFSEITLDGSNSYVINDIITDYFLGEIALISESGIEYLKYNLKNYNTLSSKTNAYAVYGDKLYVEGTDTILGFYYMSLGLFPLDNDTDTNSAITNYHDVIINLAVINYLKFIGDGSYQSEIPFYQDKLQTLMKLENRTINQGGNNVVTR